MPLGREGIVQNDVQQDLGPFRSANPIYNQFQNYQRSSAPQVGGRTPATWYDEISGMSGYQTPNDKSGNGVYSKSDANRSSSLADAFGMSDDVYLQADQSFEASVIPFKQPVDLYALPTFDSDFAYAAFKPTPEWRMPRVNDQDNFWSAAQQHAINPDTTLRPAYAQTFGVYPLMTS